VLQISPHIETVPDLRAYTEIDPGPVAVPGGESPYVSGAREREDQPLEGGREFAEILADLLLKAGTGELESAGGVEAEGVDIPLADLASALPEAEKSAGAAGRKKSPWIAKTEAGETAVKTEKAGKSAAIEAELSALDFSEEDKNILLGVELLLNQSADQISLDGEEAAFSGEINVDAGMSGGEAADIAGLFPEQLESAEMAAAFFDAGDIAPQTEAAESAENPRTSREKPELTEDFRGFAEKASNTGGGLTGAEGLASGERPVQPGEKPAPEKEGRGAYSRLEEARGRRRDRAALEVRDLRTSSGQAGESGLTSGETRLNVNASQPGGAGTREITLELRLPNQGQNAPGAETTWEVKAGQSFENLLARELHQNFNNDIVRHASMILRDEGAGTIRLALKPETLGNVKIRLEMAENKITGHIVVESEEALRAFEREVHSLEQAFKESGFEAANLEMSLAGNGGGAEQDWREAGPFLPGQMAASQYDAFERIEAPLSDVIDVYGRGLISVNMLI
jgi:hypothetical protein